MAVLGQKETRGGTGAGRLVAVVVTHNRLDELVRTVGRLLASPPEELSALVVVDNASTDGTGDWLAGQEDGRLSVVTSARNVGGAGGFELGMGHALAHLAPDWLVVMDDDARPEPGALADFHAVPRPADTAVAAAVYFPDGRVCEMNRPSVNPFWAPRIFLRTLLGGGRDGYHIPYEDYDAPVPRPVDLASFVGLFLPADAVRCAGLPEGRLFLYGDDVIYTLGLRRLGYRIVFDPAIRFEHDCATFADDRRRAWRPVWKVYYSYRNGLIMYHRAAGVLFWPLLPLLVLKWWLAARRYGAERRVYLRLMRRAVADGVRGQVRLSHDEVLALAGKPVSD